MPHNLVQARIDNARAIVINHISDHRLLLQTAEIITCGFSNREQFDGIETPTQSSLPSMNMRRCLFRATLKVDNVLVLTAHHNPDFDGNSDCESKLRLQCSK